jgi:hypothetical protein
MTEEPTLLPLPPLSLIADLESRQDEVLRDLDQLIARLEGVLAPYNAPSSPADVTSKAS